jgi:membrane fusion protein, multidrug efflux system
VLSEKKERKAVFKKIKAFKENGSKNPKFRFLVISLIGATVVLTAYYFYYSSAHITTDDAFVEGHVIPISAKVPAHVTKILVDDNKKVKAGEMLLELDERDYVVRNDIAKADLQAAQAEAIQARIDSERYQKLSADDEVSKQQLDRALLRLSTADAKVKSAQARVEQTELDMSYTKIASPIDGHVTRKSVEAGAYVQTGQILLAIISDEKWVVANFKETQLARLRPGQTVKIKIDTYSGKVFKGHVDSIQHGTGARFSLLPPENATGNFVKVVQRIPVKIVFDELPESGRPLAVGMSVVPEIDLS